MHQYICISIIYWKNKQQYNQLLSNGKTNSSTTSFNMKNCSAEQKSHDKKGCRAKKLHCKNITAKNTACVNGTIEITLEQIQHDIVTNSQCQNPHELALCVSRPLAGKIASHMQSCVIVIVVFIVFCGKRS